jgi:hypothetical protein
MLASYLVAGALVAGTVLLHLLGRRAPAGRAVTIRLSPTAALHVVEVEGRRLLIGTGSSSAPALLAELSPGTVADPGAPAPQRASDTAVAGGLRALGDRFLRAGERRDV